MIWRIPETSLTVALAGALVGVPSPLRAQAALQWEWRIAATPRVDLGGAAADSNTSFSRVIAAYRHRDGTIAIAEFNAPPVIRYFSSEGRYLKQVGRSGSGPGEFRAILSVFRAGEDSLVVYDPWQARLTYVMPTGTVGRQVGLKGAGASMRHALVGRFSDGTFLARNNTMGRAGFGRAPATGEGIHRDSIPWLHLSEDGSVLDTLLKAPGEVYDSPTENTLRIYRFTPRPAVLVAGDVFYLGSGEQYQIAAFDRRGRALRTFTRAFRPIRVTAADLAALEEETVSALPPQMNATEARTRFRALPSMDVLPAYDRFMARDPEGNLWVQDFTVPGAPRTDWSVFAEDGRFRGTVHLPSRFRLLEVGRDYVLGSWPDEDGALHVQLFDLLKKPR